MKNLRAKEKINNNYKRKGRKEGKRDEKRSENKIG